MKGHLGRSTIGKYFTVLTMALALNTGTFGVLAAQHISRDIKTFRNARDVFDKELYDAARDGFEEFVGLYPDHQLSPSATYYAAISAVRASHTDGQKLLLDFVNKNPGHPLAVSALTDLIDYYYNSGNYERIVGFVLENDPNTSMTLDAATNFKLGYAYFHKEDYAEAQTFFSKTDGASAELKYQAAYYLGCIAEEVGHSERAQNYFKEAINSSEFEKPALKRYLHSLHSAENYEGIISHIEREEIVETDPLSLRMVGDAYFLTGKFRLAAFNYQEYLKSSRRRNDYEVDYRSGVSLQEVGDLQGAEKHYKKAALDRDTLGAYASYQLGLLYMEQKNYVFAVPAFKRASSYENEIQEEAHYLQAKAEFDGANYDQAIVLFKEYSDQFKAGTYVSNVNEMLSEAYLNTDNYELAIDYIESLERLTPKLKASYQHITFVKGVELFNKRRFYESISLFEKALEYPENAAMTSDANFWIGEAYTIGKKYSEALPYYQRAQSFAINSNSRKASYGLGYAFFNMKRYPDAMSAFRVFLNNRDPQIDKRYYADALLRSGDCLFVAKEFENAISLYDQSINEHNRDEAYAIFQKGLAWRYMDESQKAIEAFRQLVASHRASDKADDAMFQLAQIKFEDGDFEDAIASFKELIDGYPDSRYVPFSTVNLAVSYYSLGQYDQAVARYRLILDRYPRHSTANSALLGLQELAGIGEFDGFEEYLTKFKNANPESDALESVEFETAQGLFYNQKYEESIEHFQRFMSNYPQSELLIDARYFVADSWFRLGNMNESLKAFYEISDEHNYQRYSRIQYRIATLETRLGNYTAAVVYAHRLKKASNNARELNNAHKALMTAHFSLQNYDSTTVYGKALLEGARISKDTEAEAMLLIGKSEYLKGNTDEALDWFVSVVNGSPDELGAEAKLFMAQIFYDKSDHNQSLQVLFELTNEFKTYELWMGKAFLLMAENYIATDETFQARATLTSLIEGSPLENITDEAEAKLQLLNQTIEQQPNDTLELEKGDERK